ncbi:hypothetical protein PGQ11_001974 [Apiospora arundinis]|uniref:Uncharacterized protein n=1 Tax=Apiospora arundinis TaxID=335852 RepID=A0ABR2JHQ8_9PEZI
MLAELIASPCGVSMISSGLFPVAYVHCAWERKKRQQTLNRHLPASAFYLSIREQVFKGGCGDWEEHNTSMNMTADISRGPPRLFWSDYRVALDWLKAELASTTLIFQAKDQEGNADRDNYLARYDYLFKLLLIGDSDVGNSKNGIKGDHQRWSEAEFDDNEQDDTGASVTSTRTNNMGLKVRPSSQYSRVLLPPEPQWQTGLWLMTPVMPSFAGVGTGLFARLLLSLDVGLLGLLLQNTPERLKSRLKVEIEVLDMPIGGRR